MSSAGDIVLHWVCPALGAVIATFLFLSPLKSVLEVKRQRCIGETNALPYAMMIANCVSWLSYGILIHDYFVYCSNISGVLLGLFYTMTCYRHSGDKAQTSTTYVLLGVTLLFSAVGLVDMGAPLDYTAQKTLWGATAVAVLVLFYTAPLTTLAKVIRLRNSSSLHWALCTMNTINGALWFAYGLAIKDWFICVPNGAGAAFNLLCVVFCFIFPRDKPVPAEAHQLPQANTTWTPDQGDTTEPSKDVLELQQASPAAAASFGDPAKMHWRSGRSNNKAGVLANVPSLGSMLSGDLAAVREGQDVETGDQGLEPAAGSPAARSAADSSGANGTTSSRRSSDELAVMP